MVRDSPLGVFKTICLLPQMIWAWLWDNQSMPSTMSKPASLKGSRDKGKEWFLMDISHPSRTVETVSIVPSANSTSYFTSRVLIGIFSSWQNFWSTKDLSAPESNSTLANILFTRKVPLAKFLVYKGLVSARIEQYSCKYIIYEKSTCKHSVVLDRFLCIQAKNSRI
ncbi:hypothetical protein HanPSC8_Chr16g0705641 [Helianthus annuus]|nr:hypothetical protein HanPSC8_Chr16g0705641 [Helianthus annuus]